MDVRQLAHKLKKGDENALSEIITEFSPVTAAVIYNLSGESISRSDREEVLADTFAALWFNRKKISEERIAGYIICIAKNKTRDKIKTVTRKSAVSIEEIDIEDEITISDTIESEA